MGHTDAARLRERIGFVDVRDGDRFAPMLTVREVVRTGATGTIGYFEQRLGMLDIDRADTLLGAFGLGPLAERRFGDCSQGERKRVLIARALVGKPRLLLLDEPGAGLDLPGREILLGSLARLADVDPELTMIVTTHHLEELHGSTTHALLLRDGVVLAAGPVEETLTDDLLTACFGIPIVAQPAWRPLDCHGRVAGRDGHAPISDGIFLYISCLLNDSRPGGSTRDHDSRSPRARPA